MRANYKNSNNNILAGRQFRGINRNEHRLVVQVERHFLDMIDGKDLAQIPKEMWIQIMMNEMCDTYPAETAEKGFYQTVMYEGKECYAVHPDVMAVFQDIVERIYAEYAVVGRDHISDIVKRWNQTLNFVEKVVL